MTKIDPKKNRISKMIENVKRYFVDRLGHSTV